jgi:hypothetical protein
VRERGCVVVKGFCFMAIIMGSGMVLHARSVDSTATTDSDCKKSSDQPISMFLEVLCSIFPSPEEFRSHFIEPLLAALFSMILDVP